jgi:alpha-beta hydrolase superfamily lysophospholipase
VPFDHIRIASGNRRLDAFLVHASSGCADAPMVVIYHGVKETISMWTKAQQFLYEHCVSSLVFHYTGSGDSSRPAKFEAVGQDSIAVYAFARLEFPHTRIYVLGHSMGNGPMLSAVPSFSCPPDGVIIANAFSSLRDFGKRSGVIYGLLAETAPDWWNNVKSVQKVKSPLF